ncbi:DNA mismatch repair endonuclease MutL [Paenibacillus hubeiensis]|uniref:DNA mismatch repair endonuclease MutL n=1 Tax=Paenibacillus hubeiensis TaxID=3077330 RepID=UPI0031BAB242
MAKIHVLDEHIANQIAAGEVVERPASVVKELLENAIDAGASKIEVSVEEGGLLSIRVKDNGSGIEPDDLETAFYRHATSKIAHGRDLFQITSLGFRGEALPSIAAVSKVEVLTASADDGRGRKIVIEGGKLCSHEDAASPQGTEFVVKELFYNTPARLKYMKTIQTELGHISDVLYRMALSHPDISFTLRHNANTLLQTLGNGDLLQVVAAIYGTSAAKAMLPIEGENLDYRVKGLISLPEWTRANRGGMSTIVNGRYIRNYGLNQAILKAYHTLLPINRYPLVVVQLDMHPSLVDVNVHPAKLEVRFSKETELYEFVETTLRGILRKEVLIPQVTKQQVRRGDDRAIIQEQFVFPRAPYKDELPAEGEGRPESHPDQRIQAPRLNEDAVASKPSGQSANIEVDPDMDLEAPAEVNEGERLDFSAQLAPLPEVPPEETTAYGSAGTDEVIVPASAKPSTSQPPEHSRGADYRSKASASPVSVKESRPAYQPPSPAAQREYAGTGKPLPDVDKLAAALKSDAAVPSFPELSLIGQHHGTYLIAQSDDGLYLIDQHAAHERVNYEYYFEKFGNPAQASQELLLPITLEFTPSETEKIKSRLAWFEQAGVYLEHFGGQTFRVRSHPYWFPHGDEKDIIEEMCEWVLSERSIDVGKLREAASIMCSCKASIKANQKLTEQEAEVLIQRLASCRQPYTCPHGRPIVVSFSTYDLEKLFKRVM